MNEYSTEKLQKFTSSP